MPPKMSKGGAEGIVEDNGSPVEEKEEKKMVKEYGEEGEGE